MNPQETYEEALDLYNHHQYAEALSRLETINEDFGESLALRANVLIQLGRSDEATALLDSLSAGAVESGQDVQIPLEETAPSQDSSEPLSSSGDELAAMDEIDINGPTSSENRGDESAFAKLHEPADGDATENESAEEETVSLDDIELDIEGMDEITAESLGGASDASGTVDDAFEDAAMEIEIVPTSMDTGGGDGVDDELEITPIAMEGEGIKVVPMGGADALEKPAAPPLNDPLAPLPEEGAAPSAGDGAVPPAKDGETPATTPSGPPSAADIPLGNEKKKISATAMGLLGAAAVVALGGFAVFWFFLRSPALDYGDSAPAPAPP